MKLALIAASAVALSGCTASREHSMAPTGQEGRAEPVAHHKKASPSPTAMAAACKISLATAIETALAKVKGRALNAETEIENGKALIEVTIVSDGKVWEVEIDAVTGAVIEVEQEDDDDDEDGDND
jgi:uncharacterized membrane protein YkoI